VRADCSCILDIPTETSFAAQLTNLQESRCSGLNGMRCGVMRRPNPAAQNS